MDCPACHHPNIDGARFCAKCGAPLPASAAPEHDPLIGAIVGGRYRITGVLGEGGMGRVYTGEQQMGTSVRKVAVKTLLSQFARDPQTVARFMRECGVVSELEHPNTIKVFDFGQTDSGELYIAMELLTGGSLEDELAKGVPISPERVDKIMAQVCGSLQEAHDKGVVHRDLKPPNIHLTVRAGEEDYVKVLDFGIAKRSEAKDAKQEQKLTQQGTILGTPPYMSPEQFMGKELDARSDIYSLGVLAYEMLTGRLPFDADTPWQWATQHMTAQPFPFETIPIGNQIPPKMRQAVMRALSKDREQRQQTARDFYDDLSIGTTRMSVLGVRAVSSGGTPLVDSGPSVSSAGSASGRGGHTQIGEPLFADGPPQPAGKTIIDAGPAPMAPMPVAQAVPTGGGQAFPAPPAPAKKGGGMGLILGIGAVVLIGGGAIGLVVVRGQGSADESEEDVTLDLPTAKPSAVAVDDDGADDDGAAEDGESSGDGETGGDDGDGGDDTSVASGTETETDTGSDTGAQAGTSTGTGTKPPPPPPPKTGGDISGCCGALASSAAKSKGQDRSKYQRAHGVCQSLKGQVQSGQVTRAGALTTVRSQLGGVPAPGACH